MILKEGQKTTQWLAALVAFIAQILALKLDSSELPVNSSSMGSNALTQYLWAISWPWWKVQKIRQIHIYENKNKQNLNLISASFIKIITSFVKKRGF